jgi:hypothetical protein
LKATVVIPPQVQAVIEELPLREQADLIRKLEYLEHFPRMYQVRRKGRFPRHRRFIIGQWLAYYRVVENTVFIRGLWPARMK